MVEKVGGWRASDGEIYPTKAAAREAEKQHELHRALSGIGVTVPAGWPGPDNIGADELIEALKPFRTPIKRASRKLAAAA